MKDTEKAIIVGAGPAGLTAAYELQEKTDIHPIVLEETDPNGGISQTVCYKGNRTDIGGHRFFSKSTMVMDFWKRMMPMQGALSKDDILIGRQKELAPNGPDPERENRVMLQRERVSHIYYLRHFFDYPISLKWKTFSDMGLWRTIQAGMGYLKAKMSKLPEPRSRTSISTASAARFTKCSSRTTPRRCGASIPRNSAPTGARSV